MTKLVFNIRTASASTVSSVSVHCKDRKNDGWSAIDLDKSHLNRQLFGSRRSVSDSLKEWYERTGAKRPAKQSENPYLTMVLSAGSEFFDAGGEAAVNEFETRSIDWLRDKFGDDLVHAELHLDETTPHIHAVVAPTYMKSKRTPGRRRKNETEHEFQERKAAAIASPGVRTVSWSSSKYAYRDSFDDLRKSCVETMWDLGITYGDVRRSGPSGQSTREFVKNMKVKVTNAWSQVKLRWQNLREREDRLLVAIDKLRSEHADLNERSLTLFQALIEVGRLEVRLSEAFRTMKKAVPLSTMTPKQRARMEPVYESVEAILKEVTSDLSEQSKKARKIDRAPEGGFLGRRL